MEAGFYYFLSSEDDTITANVVILREPRWPSERNYTAIASTTAISLD